MTAKVIATAVFGVTFAALVTVGYRLNWLRSPLGPVVIFADVFASTFAGVFTLLSFGARP